ncbi:MAG: hypothetical protein Q9159_003207 [Coniocarpon cinnabarinum]
MPAQVDGQLSRHSSESKDPEVELARLPKYNPPLYDPVRPGPDQANVSRASSLDASIRENGLGRDSAINGKLYSEINARLSPGFIHWLSINIGLVALWYLFSVSISVYNKWMFGDGQLSFKFPLFTTSLHMCVQFALASITLYLVPSLRPRAEAPDDTQTEDMEQPPNEKPVMSVKFYLSRIAPCAVATGLDIGLGNTSLELVSLAFFTMVKSSTLGFVLVFAFLFRLEKPSAKLIAIIGLMTAGVVMMVFGETAFSGIGFALLISASMFSGLRWSLTQILLKRNAATSNPIASLFFLTPIMFVVLLTIAIIVEGFGPLAQGLAELAEKKGASFTAGLLLFPGILAFLMTTAEFALIQRTSVVTLSVAGIVKEAITIGAGAAIFHDRLTAINSAGLGITIVAIIGYNIIRFRSINPSTLRHTQHDDPEEHAPMLSTGQENDDNPTYEVHRNRAPSTADLIRRSLSVSTARPPAIPSTPHRVTPSPSKKQNVP